MRPRRLLLLALIFLMLGGLHFALEWHREQKAKKAEEARKLFAVKEAEISTITLKRGPEEVHLVREGQTWRLLRPLEDQADAVALSSLVSTLAHLKFSRDLGPEPDLKPFGLEQPALVVTFTSGEKTHTLSVGKKAPGGQNYYVRRDGDPRVLLIDAGSKESLDRPLNDLRNRALFDFAADKVSALRVKTPALTVTLEKEGNRWVFRGREDQRLHSERLERLLRFLSLARIREFVADPPRDLKPYGLAPPLLEITVVTTQGEQHLAVGSRKNDLCYARRGERPHLLLIENLLLDLFTTPLEKVAGLEQNPLWSQVRGVFPHYLEDRRLWTGEVKEVASLSWGPPGKTWTAVKEQDSFILQGPEGKQGRRPATQVEMALLRLRDLEAETPENPAISGSPAQSVVELQNAAGERLFRLEELEISPPRVRLRFQVAASPVKETWIREDSYRQWQRELDNLTASLKSPEKGSGSPR